MPQNHRVSVLARRGAATDVEAVVGRRGAVEPVSATQCQLRMEVDDLSWPMMALPSVSADFEVEAPAELVLRVRQVGALVSRAT